MSDSSQTWCMVPTEPASDCATQAPTAVDESNAETMTALTTLAIEGGKDETYYWDTVKFSVQGISFKVPRYQFVIGSTYFAQKLESTKLNDNEGDSAPITLGGATLSQFRVFLKLLFPIHTTSTTLKFTKEEWLVILELSTLWDFHEFRKLAKEHLEPQLDDPIERIVLGRAAYIPRWVLDGYETLVARSECVSEQESERIGHLTTVRLYILRHEQRLDPEINLEAKFASRFGEEIHALEQRERDHMSAEERRREEEKRLEEERQRHDREEKERLEEEKARAEREEKERTEREEMELKEREEQERFAAEERKRQELKAKEARREQERMEEEAREIAEEERRRREEDRLQKKGDDRIRKKEQLRLEEERIAQEFADLEKQEEEARLQEEEAQRDRKQRAREREERERQKAQREGLWQQSKAPATPLDGFGTRGGWGGIIASSLFGGLNDEQDAGESPVGWDAGKQPSIPSLDTSRTADPAEEWGLPVKARKKKAVEDGGDTDVGFASAAGAKKKKKR